ncbi:hypothetical protein SOVF_200290 [Spinacia oleracea]|nr:hypothetical protein SOVF_200290 [Spinacia oleracea]
MVGKGGTRSNTTTRCLRNRCVVVAARWLECSAAGGCDAEGQSCGEDNGTRCLVSDAAVIPVKQMRWRNGMLVLKLVVGCGTGFCFTDPDRLIWGHFLLGVSNRINGSILGRIYRICVITDRFETDLFG